MKNKLLLLALLALLVSSVSAEYCQLNIERDKLHHNRKMTNHCLDGYEYVSKWYSFTQKMEYNEKFGTVPVSCSCPKPKKKTKSLFHDLFIAPPAI